jgi:hypothetical protein
MTKCDHTHVLTDWPHFIERQSVSFGHTDLIARRFRQFLRSDIVPHGRIALVQPRSVVPADPVSKSILNDYASNFEVCEMKFRVASGIAHCARNESEAGPTKCGRMSMRIRRDIASKG